jgi:hypothetical protein
MVCVPRSALVLVLLGLVATACSGTTGGEQGPVQVTSAMPAPGAAPAIGSATADGITVSGVAVQGAGPALTVSAPLTDAGAQPDELVSIGSNYTDTATLAAPLAVAPGRPVLVGPMTASLRRSGSIDAGATVSVTFAFRRAGTVQVFGTYTS